MMVVRRDEEAWIWARRVGMKKGVRGHERNYLGSYGLSVITCVMHMLSLAVYESDSIWQCGMHGCLAVCMH